jgi:hypothetical protein
LCEVGIKIIGSIDMGLIETIKNTYKAFTMSSEQESKATQPLKIERRELEYTRIFKVDMGTFWEVRREVGYNTLCGFIRETEYLHYTLDPTLYYWKSERQKGQVWAEKESLIDESIEVYKMQLNPKKIEVSIDE